MRARWLPIFVVLCGAPTAASAAASCHDGVKNGPESDVDCGGDCPSCAIDKACVRARDCISGLCAAGVCAERTVPRGASAPPGYELRPALSDPGATARRAGIVFFGVGYAGAYAAALSLPGRLAWMYAPILGPWLSLKNVDAPELKAVLVADGVLQASGALLIVGGAAQSGSQLVRSEELTVRVAPRIDPHGAGVGFVGSF